MIKTALVSSLLFMNLIIPISSVSHHDDVIPELNADTNLCDTYKLTLINSLRPTIDKAIEEIYENSPTRPEWATWDTEITKIRQL